MNKTLEWAFKRIQEVKEKSLKNLNLSIRGKDDQQLDHIPPEVFELKHLESLDLSDNMIKEIPDEIRRLKNLKSLNFTNNPLETVVDIAGLIIDFDTCRKFLEYISPGNIAGLVIKLSTNELPSEVLNFQNLTSLVLGGNQLTTVPESITKLQNLTSLDLGGNQLTTVPESITKLQNLTSLYLWGNQLTTVPESITKLQNLATLFLWGNQLTTVPESITRLQNLATLFLGDNQLTTVPESISKLQNLTSLGLWNNQLTTVPESISKLQNLATLFLWGNQLTTVPESISKLQNLTTLHLWNNQLTTVPESITRLQNLTSLDLNGNQLTTVPESITRLQNLTSLYLGGNQITTVPESITRLQNLTSLDLNGNQLTTVPELITKLEGLIDLNLEENPLVSPPLTVVKRGIDAIRDYFQQIGKEGKDYLYEAKLLIVGEGGAGKTSLAKKIENINYELKNNEKSTEGIEVIQWAFPVENGQQFRANIWDFGGQEIYHATHQFFLTERSLYVLVADTRKEDTDFYYWLNLVELLSNNSPLLIIKNEKQDRHREINERQLRGQFTNIKETLATNLATNRGLDEVLSKIRHYIFSMPHIGTELPKTWVKVRASLENDKRNYISLDEYLDICQQNGFTERKDKLQLSGYLHDIGVCLHFQKDPLLMKTVILNPKWGTDAVYKVLDNKKVIKNMGKFHDSALSSRNMLICYDGN